MWSNNLRGYSLGIEVFVGGSSRRDGRCVSGSAVAGGEAWWRQGTCQWWGGLVLTLSYARPGRGGRHTLAVAEAESKMEVGANCEEEK